MACKPTSFPSLRLGSWAQWASACWFLTTGANFRLRVGKRTKLARNLAAPSAPTTHANAIRPIRLIRLTRPISRPLRTSTVGQFLSNPTSYTPAKNYESESPSRATTPCAAFSRPAPRHAQLPASPFPRSTPPRPLSPHRLAPHRCPTLPRNFWKVLDTFRRF